MAIATQQPTADKSPVRQIHDKADAQLAQVARKETETQRHLVEVQAEIARIQEHALQRNKHLTDLRGVLAKIAYQCDQARNFATLAEGTPGEHDAVIALKEQQSQVKRSRGDLEQAEKQAQAEETRETERLAALQADIARGQKGLYDLAERRLSIESGRRQAHEKLLEEVYRDIAMRIELQQTTVDAKRKEVITAQLQFEEVAEEIRAQLVDFPELLPRVKSLLPAHDDELGQTLTAQLTFLDLLISSNHKLALLQQLKAVQTWGIGTWKGLFFVPLSELDELGTRFPEHPRQLRLRRKVVEEALNEYRRKQP